jgi:hypothetical protein
MMKKLGGFVVFCGILLVLAIGVFSLWGCEQTADTTTTETVVPAPENPPPEIVPPVYVPEAPEMLIPVATLVDSDGGADWWCPGYWAKEIGDYRRWQYVLKWVPEPDGASTADVVAAMNDVFDKWMKYEALMDPRPTRGSVSPSGDGIIRGPLADSIFDVAVNKKLKDGVVFMRYWLSEPYGPGGKPTVAAWWNPEYRSYRETAYTAARMYFRDMLAEIKQSPYYDARVTDADGTRNSPLKPLYTRIANFIAEGSNVNHASPYMNLDDFYWYAPGDFGTASEVPSTTSVSIDPRRSDPLYEIYFGFIPDADWENYINPATALYQ